MSKRTSCILVILLLMILSGCGLLKEPPQPVIPTPIATAPPLPGFPNFSGEQVTDPVSDIVPAIDPDTTALVNAVSQQQLMAYVQTLESFGTRNSFSVVDRDDYGVGGARRWIFNEFERIGNGRLQVSFDDFNLSYKGFTAEQRNVVATLPGTGSGDGIIIVMAHYDTRPHIVTDGYTRSSGANDNASGVALLLETARLLSSREWSQTIMFIAMAAEEQETAGSRHFAQNAFLDNMNILAVVSYDAIGGRAGIPQSVRLFAENFRGSVSGALGRYYEYVGGLYMPTFPIDIHDALDREGRWGDHREFVQVGMPAIRVMESEEDPDLVNSILDTWSLIDYSYHEKAVQTNVAVIANAAGAPHPPAAPAIVPMADPGTYLLNWPVDRSAAGYVISFRPVNSASYAPFRFVRANMAGNVVLTGYDPSANYAVSIAGLDANGRIGLFSHEIIVGPPAGEQELSISLDPEE